MTTSALPEAPFHAIESLLFATLVQLMIIILAARGQRLADSSGSRARWKFRPALGVTYSWN